MSPYLIAPLLALAALLQTTVIPLLPGGARPDLMLLIVVAWGIVRGKGEATLWGLGGGLFLDLLSGLPFGLQTIGLGAIGLLADLMETNFFRSNLLLPLAAIFVASLLFHIVEAAAMQTLGYSINWSPYVFGVIIPTAILNTLLMPIVYAILRRADHITRPRLTW
jgi:rod shape-determining protein MreD